MLPLLFPPLTWMAVTALPSSAASRACTWLVPSTTTRRALTWRNGEVGRWGEVRWGKCRGMGAGSAARAGTEVKAVHCNYLVAGRFCWAADALKLATDVAQPGREQI